MKYLLTLAFLATIIQAETYKIILPMGNNHGKIICNLDADDTLLPETIIKVVPFFANDKIIKVQWPLWTA